MEPELDGAEPKCVSPDAALPLLYCRKEEGGGRELGGKRFGGELQGRDRQADRQAGNWLREGDPEVTQADEGHIS